MSVSKRSVDSPCSKSLEALGWVAKAGLLILLRCYRLVTCNRAHCCRFYPSCSVYAIMAIEQDGAFRGCLKTLWRILRCFPFRPVKVDYP